MESDSPLVKRFTLKLSDPTQQKEYATYCHTNSRKKYPVIFTVTFLMSLVTTYVYVMHLITGEPLVEGDDIETIFVHALLFWELFAIFLTTYLFSKRFLWILNLTTPCVVLVVGFTSLIASLFYMPKDSE